MAKLRKLDRGVRWRLILAVACWIVLAIANDRIDDLGWLPEATALLSLGAAVCAGLLAIWPRNGFAYLYGAPFAVGALTVRCAAYLLRELDPSRPDYVWFSLAQITVSALLAFLYVNWWLTEVKHWQQAHRLLDR